MRILGLLAAAFALLPGCTVGHLEGDLNVGRDLGEPDLDYVERVRAEDKRTELKQARVEVWVAGRKVKSDHGHESEYTWMFPLYARRKTLVVSTSRVAVSTASEAPAIFPGITFLLGVRQEAASWYDVRTGVARVTVSSVEANPLVRLAHSRDQHSLRGWEFALGKGLLGVGASAYGPYMRLLWFLKLGRAGSYSHQNFTSTHIEPIKPAEPETTSLAREIAGSVLQFLIFR